MVAAIWGEQWEEGSGSEGKMWDGVDEAREARDSGIKSLTEKLTSRHNLFNAIFKAEFLNIGPRVF